LTCFPFESLDKVRCISEHITLRQHVKSILYQGDWPATGDKSEAIKYNNPEHSCRALLDGRHGQITGYANVSCCYRPIA